MEYTKFHTELKSLLYRLVKSKYKMSRIDISKGSIDLSFIVKNEKLVKE